jgi:immune inhibitor A
MGSRKGLWFIGGVASLFVICCICIFTAVGGASLFRIYTTARVYPAVVTVVFLPVVSPTSIPPTSSPFSTNPSSKFEFAEPEQIQIPESATSAPMDGPIETLETLKKTFVPIRDLLDLAARLQGIRDIPRTVDPPLTPYQIGDRRNFWVTNVDTNENTSIEAQLQYISEHMYFWIESGVSFDPQALQLLGDTFENDIYPTTRDFFGSEWSPGIDGDPRLYILYARNLGVNLAGYFSSADEYHPLAHEYSNVVELFLLNADNLSLDEPFTYGVLAHEFQHMIHWYLDRNEASWLNEGFSELAAFLNGYYESGFDWAYLKDPDLQLNDWPNDPRQTTPHYGAGFLFVTYFLERFGKEATQMVIQNQENGLTSVDLVLEAMDMVDPQTGRLITADDVFLDWVITNYLQDESVSDGRFAYRMYRNAPHPVATESFKNCPVKNQERSVSQYGVDYISFTCLGEFTLIFQGASEVGVLPEGPYSGDFAFWSNKGDESNMTLTQTFDFSDNIGPLTLTYQAWYDLEADYDYLYLVASTDGMNWEILETPSGTSEDPSGNSFGWGYNGTSGGMNEPVWIHEMVDLSRFAGQKVQLRFEYVTDAAVNGEGFLLDDIAITEIGYASDFESDDGGWDAQGWARIQNMLPQYFRLAMIYKGDQAWVEYVDVPNSGLVKIPIKIVDDIDEIVLVVTGTTRFTRQKAIYYFELIP